MKEDCTIYSLENCMTRKQRLKWKKDYRRTLNYIKKYEKRCKKIYTSLRKQVAKLE